MTAAVGRVLFLVSEFFIFSNIDKRICFMESKKATIRIASSGEKK